MSDSVSRPTSSVWAWRFAALLGVCLFFVCFNRDVWGSDEPRVVAIAMQMEADGQFAIPRLGGEAFVEKPPLYFIVAALGYRALGDLLGPTLAIRLTSVLWGLATVWCVYMLARLLARHGGKLVAGDGGSAPTADPTRAGLIAAAVLGTTVAFISNSNEVRTDISLACLCTFTVWAFAEAYLANRPRMLLLAGVLLAAAFLTKGPIALMFTGAGWLGLFPGWIHRRTRPDNKQPLFLGTHLVCLGLFVLGVGAWVYLLRAQGGPELFDEWFWRNQVGRFDGTAGLGHAKEGNVLYYISPLLVHALPWTPLVLAWLWVSVTSLRRLSPAALLLLAWFVLPVLVLSVSSTRRSVYILPLTPVMCLMATDLVTRVGLPGWCRGFLRVLSVVMLAMAAAMALLPLLGDLVPESAREDYGHGPIAWTLWNGLAGVAFLAGCWVFMARKVLDPALRCAVVAGLTIFAFMTVTTPLQDVVKSDQPRALAVGELFPPDVRGDIAGYGFRERWRGLLYMHLDWAVPQVERERLAVILSGDDPEYSSVIVQGDRLPNDLDIAPPNVVLAEPGGHTLHGGAFTWYAPRQP